MDPPLTPTTTSRHKSAQYRSSNFGLKLEIRSHSRITFNYSIISSLVFIVITLIYFVNYSSCYPETVTEAESGLGTTTMVPLPASGLESEPVSGSVSHLAREDDTHENSNSHENANDGTLLSDIWSSLTTSGKSATCPGECVHAFTSIFCDHVLQEISCGQQYLRCCVANDYAAPPQGTAVETSPPMAHSDLSSPSPSTEPTTAQTTVALPLSSPFPSITGHGTMSEADLHHFHHHFTESSTPSSTTTATRSTYPPNFYEVTVRPSSTTTHFYAPSTAEMTTTSTRLEEASSPTSGIECPGVCIEYRFARYCGNILSNGRCGRVGQQCCLQADVEPVKPRPTEILHAGGGENEATKPEVMRPPRPSSVYRPPSESDHHPVGPRPNPEETPTESEGQSSNIVSIVSVNHSSTTPEEGLWPRPSPSTTPPTLIPLLPLLPQNKINESLLSSETHTVPQEPCPGTCVAPLFSLLCDDIDANKYCPSGASCCLSREEEAPPPPPTTPAPTTTTAMPCPGTCIPTVLSGVCNRPSRLILKTADCSQGLICCHTPMGTAPMPPGVIGGPPISGPPQMFNPNYGNQMQPIDRRPGLGQNGYTPMPPQPASGFFGLPFLTGSDGNNNNNNQRLPPPQHRLPPPTQEGAVYQYPQRPPQSMQPATTPRPSPLPINTTPAGYPLAMPACPGTCLPLMLRFTCLGTNALYNKFHCPTASSSETVCCSPIRDIQAFESNMMGPNGNPSAGSFSPMNPAPNVGVAPPRNASYATPSSYQPQPHPHPQHYPHRDERPRVRPTAPPVVSTTTAASTTTGPPSGGGHHCGVKGGGIGTNGIRTRDAARIIGGRDSVPGEFCWHVALINAQNQYLCGGALIADQWVATAAHCVTGMVRQGDPIFVRVGDFDLTDTDPSEQVGAQTARVGTTYIHHNHNGQTLDNDIALLKLAKPVQLNHMTCLICLPSRGSKIRPGKRCSIAGYGYNTEAGPIALKIRTTDIPMVNEHDCTEQINSITEKSFTLPANSFCAGGETGEDACQGDGGSGLVCPDSEGVFELAGIVSWGFGCGREHVPGVYVKMSSFVGWINQIISVNN